MDTDIKEEFQCSICLGVLVQPKVHKPCKKNFCSECITNVIKFTTSPCPICRSPLTSDLLMTNYNLWDQIKSSLYSCDCKQTFPYTSYNDHISICPSIKELIKKASKSIRRPKIPVINRWTYKCPCCGLKNFDRVSLLFHVNSKHQYKAAKCTICLAMPWGDPDEICIDINEHLQTMHQFDYDTFTDFSMDDEEILLKVLEESLYHQ
ncbi:RNF114 [Blepharisma stoltei]|uniref:RING-type domain-containing protein n=1 Tax=Blepharisma stoltei TaxID=1481888 RepID=A0AAU9IQT2_9CILI|nr:unnamed protein product [Blepharisma stoltei]